MPAWPFKMGPICSPEKSVLNYHSTLRKTQTERERERADLTSRPKTKIRHSLFTVTATNAAVSYAVPRNVAT